MILQLFNSNVRKLTNLQLSHLCMLRCIAMYQAETSAPLPAFRYE